MTETPNAKQNIQTPGTASIQANKELTIKEATAHKDPQPTEPISSIPFIDPVPAMIVFRRVMVAKTNERLARIFPLGDNFPHVRLYKEVIRYSPSGTGFSILSGLADQPAELANRKSYAA